MFISATRSIKYIISMCDDVSKHPIWNDQTNGIVVVNGNIPMYIRSKDNYFH